MHTGNRQKKTITYPTPTTNPVNQLITSPVEADKIAEAAQRQAQREADNIMAIAFPLGPEPPLAAIDTITTQAAQSVPPTVPSASTVTTATDRLDHGRQPSSQLLEYLTESCLLSKSRGHSIWHSSRNSREH